MGGAIPSAPSASQPSANALRPRPITRSLLVVDCGSVYTKVALLGLVENSYRLIAHAQAATTITPPVADITVGVLEAIATIERITGRAIQRDGQVITPEQDDGSGVDGLALATSVGGPLRLLTGGPGRDALSGLLHRSIGGLFAQLDTLPALRGPLPPNAPEWLQMLAQTRSLHPHAILLIGASFGGARTQGSLEETAESLASWLDARATNDATGQPAVNAQLPIIFTGAPADAVQLAPLQRHASFVQSVEALSPATLTPLNRAVSALYEVAVLRHLPEYARLRALSKTPPAATITALGGLVRYLSRQFQTNVVGVDVGASSTALVGTTTQGEYLPAGHPNAGVGPGAGHILRAVGAQNVLRWLSVPLSEDDVREYVLGRMLRPRTLPMTARELEIEHALAREALLLALRAPGSRLAGLHPTDVVLGAGGVLAHVPHPAMAALILLDALQPRGITSLVLDTANLSSMLGSAAALDAAAAADVAESDAVLLQLGTVISLVGSVAEGQPALRVVLEYGDGRRHVEDVAQGSLACLPLAPGEHAMLGLYPVPTVDVGLGPGQHARASEPVEGGALGLIIDARGRPLALPSDPIDRIAHQAAWRRALGLKVAIAVEERT